MELDFALGGRIAQWQRQKEFLGHAVEHELGSVGETKASVKRRIANKNAAFCTKLPEFSEAVLDERTANTLALKLRDNRYRTNSIPTRRTIIDEYRRKGYVANNITALLCDQRN